MQQYVRNWLVHARRVQALAPYAAISLDPSLTAACEAWGEPVLDARSMLRSDAEALNATTRLISLHTGGYVRNMREGFKLLGFVKARAALALLRAGYSVLLSDADTVWLANPWPWIGSFPRPTSSHTATPELGLAPDAGLLPSADVLLTNECGPHLTLA